jgi:predicted MFS family arabinose efflux permease
MIRSVVRTYQRSFAGFPGPVWVLAGAALVNRCGTMVLAYMALYLTRTKGLDASEAGMILGAYGIGAMAGGLGAGWLCDRISAKAVQVGSLLLNGVGFLVLGQVTSELGILLMMFAIAIVSEGFRPANATALARAAPVELRTRAFALLRLAVNLGMAIGPTVGGFLAEYDYSWLFVVDGVTCILSGLLLWRFFDASDPAPIRDGDPGSTGVDRHPLRDRLFLILIGVNFLIGMVFFQLFGVFPLYLKNEYHLAEHAIGLALAINTLLIVAVEMLVIHALQARNELRWAAFGFLLIGAGFGLTAFGASWSYVAFTVAVWTFGEILALPLLFGFVAKRAGAANRGKYMGLYHLSFSLAYALAPVVGTWAYEHVDPDAVWYGALVVGVACAGVTAALARSVGPEKRSGRDHHDPTRAPGPPRPS